MATRSRKILISVSDPASAFDFAFISVWITFRFSKLLPQSKLCDFGEQMALNWSWNKVVCGVYTKVTVHFIGI